VPECLSEEKEGIRISGIGDSHKPQGNKIPLFPPFAKGDGKKYSPPFVKGGEGGFERNKRNKRTNEMNEADGMEA
jgi:hypothetical protein